MTLQARQPLPTFFQKGRAFTLSAPERYVGGELVAPTASGSTFTLRDSSGAAVISAQAIVTPVVGSIAQVVIGATDFDALTIPELGMRETWSLIESGVTQTLEREAHLVRVAPTIVIAPIDLFGLHNTWRAFVPSNWNSYDEPIAEAFNQLVGRLLGDQVYPHKVLNWYAARTTHLYWTAALVCRGFGETGNGNWLQLADTYEAKAEKAYEDTFLKVDDDDDGIAEDTDTLTAAEPELFMTAVPR
ncbi:MAG: hypothetical protein GY925_26370 [Actinomycetia bacterium]|nr:hypothetical protein [Actinomycetes bacterium]